MDLIFTMSLPTLPVLGIDEIVSYMEVWDLLALSSTCKTIHYHANRVFYTETQWNSARHSTDPAVGYDHLSLSMALPNTLYDIFYKTTYLW